MFPKCSGWLYMITVVPLALFVPHGAFWMHSFDIFLKHKQVANTGKKWEEILSSFRMFYETANCDLNIFEHRTAKAKHIVRSNLQLHAQEDKGEVSAAEVEKLKVPESWTCWSFVASDSIFKPYF